MKKPSKVSGANSGNGFPAPKSKLPAGVGAPPAKNKTPKRKKKAPAVSGKKSGKK